MQRHMAWRPVIKYLKENASIESKVLESDMPLNSNNPDLNKNGNIGYYYYKKEFVENGQVDDLFDFEWKTHVQKLAIGPWFFY